MPNSKLLIAGLLGVALVLLVACGDSTGKEPVPQANEAPDNTSGEVDDGGDSGSGAATLTIGSESWTVHNVFCTFSPEDAGNARISFSVSGATETAGGVRVHLDATIQDPKEQGRYEGDGVIHTISIDDIDNFENPTVGWSSIKGAFGDKGDIIHVDGKSVTVETTFDNSLTHDVIEETPGKLEGICP